MQNFSLETHIGADGILHLDLPVAITNTDLKVTVTCEPIASKTKGNIWDAIQELRQRIEAEGIEEEEEDVFANVRDRSPGREVEF